MSKNSTDPDLESMIEAKLMIKCTNFNNSRNRPLSIEHKNMAIKPKTTATIKTKKQSISF